MARKAMDSNALFIDGLEVPEEDRIGPMGAGLKVLMHGLNAERIMVAAAALGAGQAVLEKAARYAGERVAFGRPIGQNQAIQHPFADIWMRLQAAELATFRAAWAYDNRRPAVWRRTRPNTWPTRRAMTRRRSRCAPMAVSALPENTMSNDISAKA